MVIVSVKGAIQSKEFRREGVSYHASVLISHEGRFRHTHELRLWPTLVPSQGSLSADSRGRLWLVGLLNYIGLSESVLRSIPEEERAIELKRERSSKGYYFVADITKLCETAQKKPERRGLWQRMKSLL